MTTAKTPETKHLILTIENRIASVRLNRPEVHNAFNQAMIAELHAVFEYLASQEPGDVRAVVLSGEGRSFCAGADVNWMRESLAWGEAENTADALRMAHMFSTIDRCPVPVIGQIHGAALGGGVGLAAVCDIVIAVEGAVWGLSEVKLGIAPAVISPYVLRKIGRSQARALFLTGERFSSERALAIGLAHYVVPADQLAPQTDRILSEVLSSGPHAGERAKMLIELVPDLEPDEAMQFTAETIAKLRTSAEGQEGLKAFLEKRKPEWAV